MESDLLYKLFKYLVNGVIIFLLFRYVPKNPMSNTDIALVATVVVLTYAIIDNICSFYFHDKIPSSMTEKLLSFGQCKSCNSSEPMSILTEPAKPVIPASTTQQNEIQVALNSLSKQNEKGFSDHNEMSSGGYSDYNNLPIADKKQFEY